MLEKLTIQNIALIDRAEIVFCDGLNVLSGETGAGKSVILDSIDFALGAKADKSMIRYGQEECFVRAEFRPTLHERLREALKEAEIDEEEVLVVTRRFSMDGKSTIRINGCAVTASMLKKITACLVDVHGQSEHFYLLKESNQLRLLDKIGGERISACKAEVSRLLAERKQILSALERLGGDENERNRRLDILKFQIEELERANLKEGEEEELLSRRNKMQYAEKMIDGFKTAVGCLSADGSGIDAVRGAQRAVSALTRYDATLSVLADRLESAVAELSDLLECVESAGEETEFDEREAELVESRLDELKSLKKKYGETYEKMTEFLRSAQEEYELLSESDAQVALLNEKLRATEDLLYSACVALTAERKSVANDFSVRVTEELKTLNIPSAQFKVQFTEYSRDDVIKANSEGLDLLKFLFSANQGEPLKELGKIISGGEMSRFMLAMKAQLSAEQELGTYVFDEIDAGISGKTARVVAEKFAKIAKNTQIIAVSHLPQIASFADKQFLIEKTQTKEKTFTVVREVAGEERILEIARLLGGEGGSDTARKHAEELLRTAKSYQE